MAGHSKWKNIQRTKGSVDQARAKLFTKLSKLISLSSQNGVTNPELNSALSVAITKAKKANMPSDVIQRAIDKGSTSKEAVLFEVNYEIQYLGNIFIIAECLTENKNRTVTEIKIVSQKNNAKLLDAGSLSWQFNKLGEIVIDKNYEISPELLFQILDLDGIEDIDESNMVIHTKKELLHQTTDAIINLNIPIESSRLIYLANEFVEISTNELEKLATYVKDLEEIDDVQCVWTNAKNFIPEDSD